VNRSRLKPLIGASIMSVLAACGSDSSTSTKNDDRLQRLISDQSLTGDPTTGRDLPDISDELAQLGMQLFYSKSLGGDKDSACVSCHHPTLGGGDNLSLPVGVEADNPDLLGLGRTHPSGQPNVPRNAPTVFNIALWDKGLFHDSRVESIGKENGVNGTTSGIRTPDSAFNTADSTVASNQTLATAQARFPVTSSEEMKTADFENGSDNQAIRAALAARLQADTDWLTAFQTGFISSETAATALITYDNIAIALGEYERTMVFIDNPWSEYVSGDTSALTTEQKKGALLFFSSSEDGGAGCSACHKGDFFTDESHQLVGFPLIGNGKGDTNETIGEIISNGNSHDDFARERETGRLADRYKIRVPTLLNIEVTAPYGHTGSYQTLTDVVSHYTNPKSQVETYFNNGGWCQLDQFKDLDTDTCASLYPDAEGNSLSALEKLKLNREANDADHFATNINLNEQEIDQVVSFLKALTDPCVKDRECLADWIPNTNETNSDGNQLNAVDSSGSLL
jgi:cytochrome c peroxidase